MDYLEITLPAVILILAFILKLFVDRTATVTDVIFAVFELPVDIAFLATSLVAAFIIADQSHVREGLVSFVIYVVGAVIVVVLWRRSLGLFVADRHFWSVGTAVLGYGLCGYGLVNAVGLVTGAVQ